MKRVLAALTALAAAGILAVPAAFASPSGVTITGTTAGGVGTTNAGRLVTFVAIETNQTDKPVNEKIVLVYVKNVKILQPMECVSSIYGPNFPTSARECVPYDGSVHPGEPASFVVTTRVKPQSQWDNSGGAVARFCLVNTDTGVRGPCKTVFTNWDANPWPPSASYQS